MRLNKRSFFAATFTSCLLILNSSIPATQAADSLSVDLTKEHHCLALNIYWEARSEPIQGQQAVAAVTLNRVRNSKFPDNICKVIKQGGERRNRCQFSWWCDGKNDKPKDMDAWANAQKVALTTLTSSQEDPTDGALFYHATYVKPDWGRSMTRTTKIGRHLFFTDPSMSDTTKVAPDNTPTTVKVGRHLLSFIK
ncbi:MAG: cell wall hydrolase [Rhodospirillaceae bacterium]|jgi:spore germination cell wall hydrolase CwlJ-like protein|nr:cell wall hydrolase [Rhodospirillaceae bacterium]MBT7355253.1 cell wall hydrolase [Rhodospirillaceae bacterium]